METIGDGKFEIRAVLGKGGTGTVYDAVRRADGARVALKVILPELAGDPQVRGRFLREARILERLEGSFICPVLEHGELPSSEDGVPGPLYLALQKVDGPTLERVIASTPDALLPIDRVLDVMDEVLRALASAHAQGVVHRDLKPANVILEGGTHVKVVDFGLAKIVAGAGTGTTNLTAHNMLFGTPEYMAPEQARGDEVDARVDVYAAGVMLYQLLTGTLPFTGESSLAVLTAHLTSAVPLPSERAPERVTPDFEQVVLTALAREPERRFPSADAFADALRRARASSLPPVKSADALASTHPELHVPDARHTTQPSASFAPGQEPPPTPRSPRGSKRNTTPAPTSRPSRPSRPSSAPKSAETRDPSLRAWILLWVLVGVASVVVGAALGLR